MAQFQTSYLHNGWYDTQFSMPAILQHPYSYPTSPPLNIIPYNPWLISLQLYDPRPPPYTPHFTSKLSPPSPFTKAPANTPSSLRPLRSILKRASSCPSQPRRQKSVHFQAGTFSPRLAAPGTYKNFGRPKPPRSRHPARYHPCLVGKGQQHARVTPETDHVSKLVSKTSVRPKPAGARPPTPPPAAFFGSARDGMMGLSPVGKRREQRVNNAAPGQLQQPVPLQVTAKASSSDCKSATQVQRGSTKKPIQVCHKPLPSKAEKSNTDIWLAKGATLGVRQMAQGKVTATVQVNKMNAATVAKAAATRRSLLALARDFDRKNAWRRSAG